jgi:hypothetical protein
VPYNNITYDYQTIHEQSYSVTRIPGLHLNFYPVPGLHLNFYHVPGLHLNFYHVPGLHLNFYPVAVVLVDMLGINWTIISSQKNKHDQTIRLD